MTPEEEATIQALDKAALWELNLLGCFSKENSIELLIAFWGKI
jgi:hypothetical protein